MSNNTTFRLRKLAAGTAMRCCRVLQHIFIRQIILIHTPKCAGTYINQQYNIQHVARIKSVGHAHFRTLQISPRTKIVGLIREPSDWYASYYYFSKKSLSEAPQSITNFPAQHPISIFSRNTEVSLEQMMSNMADREYLESILTTDITANVYARDIQDIFDFMKRTESGFWTWTMMYHFSKKDTRQMKNRMDVIREAKVIASYIGFIHQENINADVEKFLNLQQLKGEHINVSPRPSDKECNQRIKSIVKKLDGEVAYILGGYF